MLGVVRFCGNTLSLNVRIGLHAAVWGVGYSGLMGEGLQELTVCLDTTERNV